jgi:hypothetical protein
VSIQILAGDRMVPIHPIAEHVRARPGDDVRRSTWSADCPYFVRDEQGNLVRIAGLSGFAGRQVLVAGEA